MKTKQIVSVTLFAWGDFDCVVLFASADDAEAFAAEWRIGGSCLRARAAYTSDNTHPRTSPDGRMRDIEDRQQVIHALNYEKALRRAAWSKRWAVN